jgi:hypothetical protein
MSAQTIDDMKMLLVGSRELKINSLGSGLDSSDLCHGK